MADQSGNLASVEFVTPVPMVVVSQPVLRIESFLGTAHMDTLWGRAVELWDGQAPWTGHGDEYRLARRHSCSSPECRRSWVVCDLGDAQAEFESMILACLPMLRQVFGVPQGDPGGVEIQLTMSGDGDYFGVHYDTQHGGPVASRVVTFVYYFSGDQAAFTGGDLIVYDSPMCAPNVVASTRHVIPPTRNSIVFFRSTAWHEVTPVVNPSERFGDGRFTVTGWLHWGCGSTGNADCLGQKIQ